MATAPKATMAPAEPDYQTQSDLRTLMEAHAIQKDSARHKRVKAHAKTQLAGMKMVASSAPVMPAATAPDTDQDGE